MVVEGASAGSDTVRSTALTYVLANNIENLSFIGTGNFTGTGNYQANRMSGGDGDDVLDGGYSADTLIGGKGNDVYKVNNRSDIIQENANEGIDTIHSTSTNYTLGANVETWFRPAPPQF